MRRLFADFPGSARLWRAGFGILPKQSFPKVRDRLEAIASTLQACAPQIIRVAIVSFVATSGVFADADTDAKFDWFKPFEKLTAEYSFEETYIGEAAVRSGQRKIQDFDEHDSILRFVATPRTKLGVLRLGVEWEHYSFGFPARTPLPNTFQELSAIIGLDTQLSDSILLRFEAEPGFYGTNNFDADQVNAPFLVGGTYIYNANLQFVAGVSVDVEREYPVIPAAGIRWKFHRLWVANLVLPTPRIEFQATKDITLYLGGNIKQTNFRVDSDFGDTHGDRRLNHAALSYSEVRVGPGVDWKIASWLTMSAEAGYQPYRSFDFFRADVRFHEDGSAPYGMISLHGAF